MRTKLQYIGMKLISIFLTLTFVIIIAAILSAIAGYYFLSSISKSPRELTKFSHYIETKFQKQHPDLFLTIGKITIQYDTNDKKINLDIKNVNIKDKNNNQRSFIPESYITISLKDASINNLLPSNLKILDPEINIVIEDTSSTSITNFDQETINYHYNKILTYLVSNKLDLLDQILISNMKISLDSKYNWNILIPNMNLTRRHYVGITYIDGKINYKIEHDGQDSGNISINTTYNKWNNHLLQKLTFTPIPLSKIKAATQDLGINIKIDDYIQGNTTLSGALTLKSTPKNFLESLDTEVKLDKFLFNNQKIFAQPININSSYVKLGCKNWCKDIDLYDFNIQTDDNVNIKSNGNLLHKEDSYNMSLNFELADFNLNLLPKYWPLGLADNPRTWMTSHMQKGEIGKTSGNTKLYYDSKTGWSLKILSINMPFKNTDLIYDLDFEPITNIEGLANFTTDSIAIEATAGDILNSKITDARITIPYCLEDEIKNLTIYGNTVGPESDLLYFVNPESLKFSSVDYDFYKITGEAKTHINLSIPIDTQITYNDIKYNISTYITNATLPKLYKNYNMTNAEMHILLTNDSLKLTGDGNFNKVKTKFSTDIDLINAKFTKPLEIDMDLDPDLILSLLPNDKIVEISGDIPAKIMVDMNNNKTSMQLDITNNKVVVPILNFTKESGHAMGLTLDLDKMEQNDKFNLKATGENIHLEGEVIYDSRLKQCTYIKIPKANLGTHSIELLYSSLNGDTINLYSDYIDITSIDLQDFIHTQDSNSKTSIDIHVDTIVMKNDEKFTDLKAVISCNDGVCENANLQAFSSKDIKHSIFLKDEKNKRNFTFKSSDIGKLLKALDISKNVVGGNLNIETSAPIGDKDLIYKGNITVNNYFLKNTPTIMNLFGLASFATFINQNQKDGLHFNKLEGPISFHDNVIKIKDLRAKGVVLDMSFSGKINLQDSKLAIIGYIIPSVYGINNLLTNIPLFGKLIVGKGLLSTQFFISGSLDNPKSTINPLSVITPGFLNNLIPDL